MRMTKQNKTAWALEMLGHKEIESKVDGVRAYSVVLVDRISGKKVYTNWYIGKRGNVCEGACYEHRAYVEKRDIEAIIKRVEEMNDVLTGSD